MRPFRPLSPAVMVSQERSLEGLAQGLMEWAIWIWNRERTLSFSTFTLSKMATLRLGTTNEVAMPTNKKYKRRFIGGVCLSKIELDTQMSVRTFCSLNAKWASGSCWQMHEWVVSFYNKQKAKNTEMNERRDKVGPSPLS